MFPTRGEFLNRYFSSPDRGRGRVHLAAESSTAPRGASTAPSTRRTDLHRAARLSRSPYAPTAVSARRARSTVPLHSAPTFADRLHRPILPP